MYNPVTEVLTMSVGRLLRHKFTEMPIQNEKPENINTAVFYFHGLCEDEPADLSLFVGYLPQDLFTQLLVQKFLLQVLFIRPLRYLSQDIKYKRQSQYENMLLRHCEQLANNIMSSIRL